MNYQTRRERESSGTVPPSPVVLPDDVPQGGDEPVRAERRRKDRLVRKLGAFCGRGVLRIADALVGGGQRTTVAACNTWRDPACAARKAESEITRRELGFRRAFPGKDGSLLTLTYRARRWTTPSSVWPVGETWQEYADRHGLDLELVRAAYGDPGDGFHAWVGQRGYRPCAGRCRCKALNHCWVKPLREWLQGVRDLHGEAALAYAVTLLPTVWRGLPVMLETWEQYAARTGIDLAAIREDYADGDGPATYMAENGIRNDYTGLRDWLREMGHVNDDGKPAGKHGPDALPYIREGLFTPVWQRLYVTACMQALTLAYQKTFGRRLSYLVGQQWTQQSAIHLHLVVPVGRDVTPEALAAKEEWVSSTWLRITGDSYIVDWSHRTEEHRPGLRDREKGCKRRHGDGRPYSLRQQIRYVLRYLHPRRARVPKGWQEEGFIWKRSRSSRDWPKPDVGMLGSFIARKPVPRSEFPQGEDWGMGGAYVIGVGPDLPAGVNRRTARYYQKLRGRMTELFEAWAAMDVEYQAWASGEEAAYRRQGLTLLRPDGGGYGTAALLDADREQWESAFLAQWSSEADLYSRADYRRMRARVGQAFRRWAMANPGYQRWAAHADADYRERSDGPRCIGYSEGAWTTAGLRADDRAEWFRRFLRDWRNESPDYLLIWAWLRGIGGRRSREFTAWCRLNPEFQEWADRSDVQAAHEKLGRPLAADRNGVYGPGHLTAAERSTWHAEFLRSWSRRDEGYQDVWDALRRRRDPATCARIADLRARDWDRETDRFMRLADAADSPGRVRGWDWWRALYAGRLRVVAWEDASREQVEAMAERGEVHISPCPPEVLSWVQWADCSAGRHPDGRACPGPETVGKWFALRDCALAAVFGKRTSELRADVGARASDGKAAIKHWLLDRIDAVQDDLEGMGVSLREMRRTALDLMDDALGAGRTPAEGGLVG